MSYYLFKCKYATSNTTQHYFNMCLNEQQSQKFEDGTIKYQYCAREQYQYADIKILNKKQISKQTYDEIADVINNEHVYSKLYQLS